MKYIKSIFVITLILSFAGCQSVLDKQPLDIISDAVVWQDEALADAYLNDIYYRADFVNLTRHRGYNQAMLACMGGEMRVYGAWQQPYRVATSIIDENGPFRASAGETSDVEYWKYNAVRDANYFIEQMETVAEFDTELTLPSSDFQKLIRDMVNIGENCIKSHFN